MLLPVGLSMRALQDLRNDAERLTNIEFRAQVLLGRSRARLQEIEQTTNYLSLFRSGDPDRLRRAGGHAVHDGRQPESLFHRGHRAPDARLTETLREQAGVATQLAETGRGGWRTRSSTTG